MARISKGAQARSFQAWRTQRSGWRMGQPWPISNDDCKAQGLPHQGEREKARRVRQSSAVSRRVRQFNARKARYQ